MKKTNKNNNTTLYIILGIITIIIGFTIIVITTGIHTYNNMIIAKTDVQTQWSNTLSEYQRRADLFYNLAETTKSYAKFEQDTMTAVIKARSGTWGTNKAEQMQNIEITENAFIKMMAVWEAYPNLKANEQYNQLTSELKNTENRIQIARSDYNGVVRNYNIYIKKFPNNIIASMFNFQEENMFENEPETNKSPKINMTI